MEESGGKFPPLGSIRVGNQKGIRRKRMEKMEEDRK